MIVLISLYFYLFMRSRVLLLIMTDLKSPHNCEIYSQLQNRGTSLLFKDVPLDIALTFVNCFHINLTYGVVPWCYYQNIVSHTNLYYSITNRPSHVPI